MRTEIALGTYDAVMADASPRIKEVASRLRDIIIELHPDTVEVPRAGEHTITYGLGPKKMSEAYVYLAPQRDYVNLGFFYGMALPDPKGLLEGSGKAMRHVKVKTVAAAERPALSLLIEAAIEERRAALGMQGEAEPG